MANNINAVSEEQCSKYTFEQVEHKLDIVLDDQGPNKVLLGDGTYGDLPSTEGFATEEYVNTKVAELVNSAPETLDTLGELATAFSENSDVVNAINEAIVNKVDNDTLTETLEDYSTKDNVAEQISNMKVTVNNGKFKMAISPSGFLAKEPYEPMAYDHRTGRNRIFNIDEFYFVNEINHVRVFVGTKAIESGEPFKTIGFNTQDGSMRDVLNFVAIVKQTDTDAKQYIMYIVDSTGLYFNEISKEELLSGDNLVRQVTPVNDVGGSIPNSLDTTCQMVASYDKMYFIPGPNSAITDVMVFPNPERQYNPMYYKFLNIAGWERLGPVELVTSASGDLFVFSAQLNSWTYCIQNDTECLLVGMYNAVKMPDGQVMRHEELPIQKMFRWKNYIVGECYDGIEDPSRKLYYYYDINDLYTGEYMWGPSFDGIPFEEAPELFQAAFHIDIAEAPRSEATGSYIRSNIIAVTDKHIIISGDSHTIIYEDLFDTNKHYLVPHAERVAAFHGVIETPRYLLVAGVTSCYKIPYHTHDISIEEAINRL